MWALDKSDSFSCLGKCLLFLRSEPRAGGGGGRPQGLGLADPTSGAGARAVLKRPSRQSPGPARAGPSPGALALTMLTWGPQEKPKGGRTPDVHTELPIVCVQRSRLDVHTELPIVCVQRSRPDVHTELAIVCVQPSRLDVHTELPIVCVQPSRLDVHTELAIVCVQPSRLDVHTELPIVCVRESPFGARSRGGPEPPPCLLLQY